MAELIPNPFWTALTTEQQSFALGSAQALRFAADVIPFGAVPSPSPESLAALHDLLTPGESIFVTMQSPPVHPGLVVSGVHPGLQMHHTGSLAALEAPRVEPLTVEHVDEMLALTAIAFPGFLRRRTLALGAYFGVRSDAGELVAMAGERLALPGLREVSSVCTHPSHTGRGYAARLITTLLHRHRAAGFGSMLHVLAASHHPIALYERLGFTRTGEVLFFRVQRAPRE